MARQTILCVDDEEIILNSLKEQLRRLLKNEYHIEVASSGAEALEILEELTAEGIDVPIIISDQIMPGMKGDELLAKCHHQYPKSLKIFLTGRADVDAIGNAINSADLYRFLSKPWDEMDLQMAVSEGLRSYGQDQKLAEQHDALKESYAQAQTEISERKKAEQALQKAFTEIEGLKEQLQVENIYLREEIKLEHNFEEIIGQSDELKYVLYKLEQVAPTDAAVLILGETGTGKELFARAIHNASNRKNYPLVKVNCATLPSSLIESELFGHEKGAFTGAITKKIGRFEFANRATLFLDEIGELPLELQPKLLRVLQDGEFERLGSHRTQKVDVRIIAATNRDLESEVEAGQFRQDLFYRLNVYPISVPSLRQRKDDIPLLVQTFVQRFSKKMGRNVERIPQSVMKSLQEYAWPGNVRELENIIERSVITTQGTKLELADNLKSLDEANVASTEQESLETVTRRYMVQVLGDCNWRIEGAKGAARILDLHPNTLRFRMRKLGIERPGK